MSKFDYFRQSQEVKDWILATPLIINNLKSHFHGQKSERIGQQGDNVNVYRIGELGSDIWVAIRSLRSFDPMMPERAVMIYEDYCAQAEMESEMGKLAPRFAIGGSYNGLPFLLVEDLSVGGEWKIISAIGNAPQYREKNGEKQRIYVDLNDDILTKSTMNFNENNLKYFHPDNRLNLI